ncbi:Family of serine hydrolases 3 [Phytophthora pseudosyringae]|uniref:Family of serine hydrolases 3 n=1 Tax=Phytophthora pseudosyringae TaxID=221518 RepID=A0A8T1W655_9STRA|nr:Family of serine hydrolases 3 [Phytophthora pseudosyringae]
MNKFRVLCLHGYRQDALKLRGRIAALRRTFKSSVEFVCLDAPFEVPYDPTSEEHANKYESLASGETGENVKQLKWCDFTRDEETGQYLLTRVEEAIEYVATFVKNEGPFDGIFGFSQGGTMASLILQRQVSTPESPFAFRFAFFVSAGAVGDSKYRSDVKVDMPSLHIIGETDAVVDNERSLALKDFFVNPKVLMHPGGHYIPTNKEPKDAYRAFFKELRESDEKQ